MIGSPGSSVAPQRKPGDSAISASRSASRAWQIKSLLEDACDNVFNPDPYYQQGGDMVRVGGLKYMCDPTEVAGKRISNLTLNGKPLDAGKRYKVASWAPGAEAATGEPVWDVVGQHLRAQKVVRGIAPNSPTLLGIASNPGYMVDEPVVRPAAAPAPASPLPAKAPPPKKPVAKKG